MPDFTIFALQPERGNGPYVAAVLEGAVDSVDDADTTPGYTRMSETVEAHSALAAEINFLLDYAAIGVEQKFPDELQKRDALVHGEGGEGEVQVIDEVEDLGDDFVLHFEDGSTAEFDSRAVISVVTLYRERKEQR